jgi:hypothetical protein
MIKFIDNIPDISPKELTLSYPKDYRFYVLKYALNCLKINDSDLWLEFGVATGKTINIISSYTENKVYGFDSFEGLPEKWRDGFDKGAFNMNGNLPIVNSNVELIKGYFSETLPEFLKSQNKKISFLHIDCDLYSSTKFVLDNVKDYIENGCIIVFDELVNYEGFDGETGELLALYEFIQNNNIKYEWIGMNGTLGLKNSCHENVAMRIIQI